MAIKKKTDFDLAAEREEWIKAITPEHIQNRNEANCRKYRCVICRQAGLEVDPAPELRPGLFD